MFFVQEIGLGLTMGDAATALRCREAQPPAPRLHFEP
jgi:hypothetical protein